MRLIDVEVGDSVYDRIGEAERELNAAGRAFFTSWSYRRDYTTHEQESADLFRLVIKGIFEPAGEECGTVYDESTECAICEANRVQISELRLDVRRVPKGRDIAMTIAEEWIVSSRLADLIREARLTGATLRPVAIVRGNTPWSPTWHQLVPTSRPVAIADRTRIGADPFDDDPEGKYRCPFGHVKGLNLLSELWIDRSSWDRSDFVVTKELVGARRGLLVPKPLILISQRFRRLLEKNKIKGFRLEVAHLV